MMQTKHQKRFIGLLLLMTVMLLMPGKALASMPADTKMSIDVKSTSVEQVLNEIHRKAKIDFFYDANLAKNWPKITLRAVNKTAEEIIGQVANLINCTYSVKGNIVTISQKQLSGRERTVKGYVRDEDGKVRECVHAGRSMPQLLPGIPEETPAAAEHNRCGKENQEDVPPQRVLETHGHQHDYHSSSDASQSVIT